MMLHVESEVLEVTPSRSRPDRGFVTLKSETNNQKDEVVQLHIVQAAGLAAARIRFLTPCFDDRITLG